MAAAKPVSILARRNYAQIRPTGAYFSKLKAGDIVTLRCGDCWEMGFDGEYPEKGDAGVIVRVKHQPYNAPGMTTSNAHYAVRFFRLPEYAHDMLREELE